MVEVYLEKYVDLCLQLDEYTKAGVKRHNNAMRKLSALFSEVASDKKLAEELFSKLMMLDDERIKATAAAHCLGLNLNLKKAEETLKNIAKNSKEPLARFNAEMTLEVWKEQGYLTF